MLKTDIAGRAGETAGMNELVHKHNREEVLLTGWHRTGPDTFEVTARWPRDHAFYVSDKGVHDPLILTETVRQLLPLLSHAAYDVPFGHHLIWDDFHYDVDAAALRPDGPHALLDLRVHCTDVVRRGGRAAAMVMRVEIRSGGRRVGEARTRFTVHSPAVYRRLRGAHGDARRAMDEAVAPPLPVPAARVGRTSPYDVTLSPGSGPADWTLCVDTSHPVLFDHPVDHAPGMLLLEAARQAAQAVVHPQPVVPVALHADFHRYVELDAPCRVAARPLPADASGRARVRVTMEQHGTVCCAADVTLERAFVPVPVLLPHAPAPLPEPVGATPGTVPL